MFRLNNQLARAWQANNKPKTPHFSTSLKAVFKHMVNCSSDFFINTVSLQLREDNNTAHLLNWWMRLEKKLARKAPLLSHTPWQTKVVQMVTVAKSKHKLVKQDLSFKMRPFRSYLLVAKQKYACPKVKNHNEPSGVNLVFWPIFGSL